MAAGDSNTSLTVRQIDLDANGLFADPRDQIQIDLDGNGKFNPFLETFPMRPVMKVRGERWFVKADRFGERIRFDSATATGKVQMKAEGHSDTDRITSNTFRQLILSVSRDRYHFFQLHHTVV